jgi:hypothetical protein
VKRFYLHLVAILLLGVFSARAQNTNGTDFWVTFGLNPAEAKSNPNLRIRIVSNEKPVKGSIYFTAAGTTIAINIPAQTVKTFDLIPEEVLYAYNTVQGKSNLRIHITTDTSVMVYVMNQNNLSTDATNLLPVPALGTEYYHISYQPFEYGEQLDAYAVIAIEDNTKFYHDGIYIETLNTGQVYYKTNKLDMTGRHITSDKPVAFFALNQGPVIPISLCNPDCLMQQLPPVNTWGKTFFVPVTIAQNEIVRIVVSQNNTNITQLVGGTLRTVQGAQMSLNNLQAGEFLELDILLIDNGCYIEADKPIGVCTYITVPEYVAGRTVGDPSQCWVPAIEQSVTQALLTSFVPNQNNTAINQHHVLIATPTNTKENTKISIGGSEPASLSGGIWRDHVSAGMSFYNMELIDHERSHFIFNNAGIIVLCYGLGQFESYYYPAFSAIRNLSAAFYANDIHYQDLPEHLFCTNSIQFRADINNLGTEVQTIKWYINETEEISAQNKEIWEKSFLPDIYSVKMWISSADDDILTVESILNIGAQISTAVSPEDGGSVEGSGCYQVGEEVTLIATSNIGYLFVNWTEGVDTVYQNPSYTFTVTESRNLTATFAAKSYLVNVNVNNSEHGYAIGAGEYGANATATVSAFPNQCYQFANWTIDTVEVSTDTVYSFIVKEDVSLIANFYDLDFDTYTVMICEQIFLLNLRKLTEDGYEVIGCKWLKNGIEVTDTHTQSEFSYSEGDGKLLEMEPNYYMFQLITSIYGDLCSSKRIIVSRDKASQCITADKTNTFSAYPNPILSGASFTLAGNIKDSPIFVYNHFGACVHSMIANDNLITLTLQLPQGIYLIRAHQSHVKIIITN